MEIIETLINGLSSGGTYAMIALGYTMVYGIAKMLNFAHGDIIMVGGYMIFVTMAVTGSPIIGIIAAILFCVLLGITIEKVAYKPLRGASPLAVLITAIGVSYLLQSTAQMIFGSAPKMVIIADLGNITVGSLKIPVYTVITLICSFAVMIALNLFV
ncbi:MAG: branched-chain amino acid ABC transporter permease, partial [Acutalibacteraceae bacterium]|nr:branched-chain amino acid ABC transporter permease [Acutalibacteraceae bacterium]